ncbi:MAG: flotillin-like protein FloA, partial [Planctomycetaceae bacterium]|nr:flotillin-like protein FloA [Planctomycetaceae bacterium]
DYPITQRKLEAHYLAGGNVTKVIKALVASQRAGIDLNWDTAQAIDLAGRDVLDAVRTSVYPKVIDCPDPKRTTGTLDAVAGDGIQLCARARVTVRTNIAQLIGGATEETVIARVGQGIVQAIGSTPSYKKVLENPDFISKIVLSQGLEGNTAYEIVSIDIADIDVGENIGARLMADQAEADMRVAQAKAEQLRADQTAREQEMVALIQENRAKVVLAEAQVPKAIAEAFSGRKLGLLDYYELKNVQADTSMRQAIAGPGAKG